MTTRGRVMETRTDPLGHVHRRYRRPDGTFFRTVEVPAAAPAGRLAQRDRGVKLLEQGVDVETVARLTGTSFETIARRWLPLCK